MTRLFLRFYVGVIFILFVASLIANYVYATQNLERNIAVIEEALGGGALLARDEFIRGGEEEYLQTMERVESRFKYPIRVIDRSERPMPAEMDARLDQGEAVYFWGMIQASLPSSPYLVELGPLPQFVGPSDYVELLALAAIFLLTAVAIAFLLRPVVKQLRTVETVAMEIANGDFSARIEDKSSNTVQLSHAFNTMANHVENSIKDQKEFLQAVSHELRTPLARIRFASELIRTAKDDEQRDTRIIAIETATEELDELVGELLNYVRFGDADQVANQVPVNVPELIEEVVESHRPLAPNLSFHTVFSDAPTNFLTHRNGLARAIGNLIGNACKFGKTKVEVSATTESERLLITVDDDGNGIEEAYRERIFEPFHRANHETPPGHGLGLALVRRICSRMDGTVIASESPLGGARFQIQLPIKLNVQTAGSSNPS
ncbi:MAG: HAMP domain-containing protein [Planctomycetaceae bacterium]|nr:HAMP domain-containing protein [Planctomycetaceae bacterium]